MSTITAGPSVETLLDDEMLARFDERAPIYDRENRFFTEDLDELRASGYLLAAVPADRGGAGLPLDRVMALQRRLAYHAPATAIAVNMHLYWTGLAADMRRFGDERCAWVLDEAAAGHVFAAGHGEAGNELGLFASNTTAERVEGGWIVSGRKIFGSLSPVWTYLGLHAMDTSDPAAPRVIHAFLPRDADGYRIEQTWDALGMRATASHDTVLDQAFVPDHLVPVVVPAGAAGADLFHLSLMAWGLLGFASVYAGVAQRAYDIVVDSVARRSSNGLSRSMAHHPEVQRGVAEMRMALEGIDAHLGSVTSDWAAGVDHGADWVLKIVTAKHLVVTRAFEIVDAALDLTGGAGVFKRHRLEQLFRDARLGRMHPVNKLGVHEIVAKTALGIDLDAQPRWG
jgi:alkylation response protein AidB-like acyl-CoA dehydrogenase